MNDIAHLYGVIGVYCIKHVATGRRYIGSSINIGKRIRSHINEVSYGSKMAIHRAMRQYGVDAFVYDLVEACEKHLMREREKHWIQLYDTASINGFNTVKDPTKFPELVGCVVSAVAMQRRTATRMANGTYTGEAYREKQRNSGKRRPPIKQETRDKLSEKGTGKRHTLKTRHQMRVNALKSRAYLKMNAPESVAKRNETNSKRDRRHTAETRAHLSMKKTGVPMNFSQETLQKFAIQAAKLNTPEIIAKRGPLIKEGWARRHAALRRPSEGVFHVPQTAAVVTPLQQWAMDAESELLAADPAQQQFIPA